MRVEPVWAYRHLWLAAQQVMLDNSPTNCKKSINCCGIGFACWRRNVVRCYHQLMIEWLADVLKGSQSTVGRDTAAEANPGIPEGRYSNPADNQNRQCWCCLRIHTEKTVHKFPSRIPAHQCRPCTWAHSLDALCQCATKVALGELLICLSFGKATSWR